MRRRETGLRLLLCAFCMYTSCLYTLRVSPRGGRLVVKAEALPQSLARRSDGGVAAARASI